MMGRGIGSRSEKGVTLIELVIVMAIIAIMALFMAPSLGDWAAAFLLRGATKNLEDALQLARLKAISTGMQYRVQLNINNTGGPETFVVQQNNPTTGWTNDGVVTTLPSGVNIVRVNPGNIQTGIINLTFNTNGMNAAVTAYTIDLTDRINDQFNVTMSQTGVVSLNTGW
jgi:prepilin-type N-terminal cleavage/methylation domain-containing protein